MVLAKLRKPFKKEPTITHLIFSFKICISVVLNYKVTSIQNNLIKCVSYLLIGTAVTYQLLLHATLLRYLGLADTVPLWLVEQYWCGSTRTPAKPSCKVSTEFSPKITLKASTERKNKTPFYFIMCEWIPFQISWEAVTTLSTRQTSRRGRRTPWW